MGCGTSMAEYPNIKTITIDGLHYLVNTVNSRNGWGFSILCRKGHPFSPENTRVWGKDDHGVRSCKTCQAEGQKRRAAGRGESQ